MAFSSTVWDRIKAAILGLYGVTALLLTAVGVFAVVSHSVSLRRREIGIRIALGCQPRDIRRSVVRHVAGLIAAGLGAGLIVVFALSRVLSNHLYGITFADPLTLVLVSLVLGLNRTVGLLPAGTRRFED